MEVLIGSASFRRSLLRRWWGVWVLSVLLVSALFILSILLGSAGVGGLVGLLRSSASFSVNLLLGRWGGGFLVYCLFLLCLFLIYCSVLGSGSVGRGNPKNQTTQSIDDSL